MFSLDDKALKGEGPERGLRPWSSSSRPSARNPRSRARRLQTARVLEGSVRNTGIHACGVIITPDDITNFVPVATAKDSNDGVHAVRQRGGGRRRPAQDGFLGPEDLDGHQGRGQKREAAPRQRTSTPTEFPWTTPRRTSCSSAATRSASSNTNRRGCRSTSSRLQPTVFEDLIAMNALYRPGPMEYIPDFVARKHGRQAITYDLDACQEYLEETYGITVYQEQVMLLSQKLAGFSKGEADSLRKAMGKKKKDIIDKMKPDFMDARQPPRDTTRRSWRRFGRTGKPLPPTPSTSRTPRATHGWPTKRPTSRPTTRRSSWRRSCPTT